MREGDRDGEEALHLSSLRSPASYCTWFEMAARVQASTSPTVHVVTTPDLDSALARNRFRSLAHLLEPFLSTRGTERIQTRTPATYDQVTHDYFPVRLVSAEDQQHSPAAAVDLFLDQVGQDIAANVQHWLSADGATATTPWYDAVRDAVLARRDLARDLDSFDAPLATLVALSTANPDPLNALAALWDRAAYHPADQLRFILLVHDHGRHPDDAADWSDAQKLHDTIRKTYGLHTALVPLFSAAPTAPHPEPPAPEAALAIWNWDAAAAPSEPSSTALIGLGVDESGGRGDYDDNDAKHPAAPHTPAAELSTQDLTALATFSREFVVQSLVPFLERTAIVAHEQWIASRRSLGGRLFSVGRKYFGGGGGGAGQSSADGGSRAASPGPAGAREGYNSTKGVYVRSFPLASPFPQLTQEPIWCLAQLPPALATVPNAPTRRLVPRARRSETRPRRVRIARQGLPRRQSLAARGGGHAHGRLVEFARLLLGGSRRLHGRRRTFAARFGEQQPGRVPRRGHFALATRPFPRRLRRPPRHPPLL